MTVYEFNNYRDFLKTTLAQKMQRNPNFSLRAMARQSGIAGSTLSEVINGRANLSMATARKIARALNLKSNETNYLCELVQLASEKDPETREQIINRIKSTYRQAAIIYDLSLEQFKQISEWYHSAILELALLKDFNFSAQNI